MILQELLQINEDQTDRIKNFKGHTEKQTGYDGRTDWVGGTNPIEFDGVKWYFTGKAGTNIKSKKQSFEYESSDHGRIWVTIDGDVERD